jgi:hypothetical protein
MSFIKRIKESLNFPLSNLEKLNLEICHKVVDEFLKQNKSFEVNHHNYPFTYYTILNVTRLDINEHYKSENTDYIIYLHENRKQVNWFDETFNFHKLGEMYRTEWKTSLLKFIDITKNENYRINSNIKFNPFKKWIRTSDLKLVRTNDATKFYTNDKITLIIQKSRNGFLVINDDNKEEFISESDISDFWKY